MEARHVLVLGDSLSFHGPDQPYRPSDPRLYPNVMAAALAEALGDAGARGPRRPASAGPRATRGGR